MDFTAVPSDDMRDLAFSIPQIQESIFRHGGLSPRDLANASGVNRIWLQIVSPFLWENITITTVDHNTDWLQGFKIGAASNGHWTRTLTTTIDLVLDRCSQSLTCTRLHTIDVGPMTKYSSNRNSLLLLKLVSQNSDLKTLRWHEDHFDNDHQFSEISPGLLNGSDTGFLTTLNLRRLMVDQSLCEVLNHSSASMTELTLWECHVGSTTFGALQNSRAEIRKLVLNGNLYPHDDQEDIENQFLKFLEPMTGLVELTLWTCFPGLIRAISDILARRYRNSPERTVGGGGSDIHVQPLDFLETLSLGYLGEIALSGEVVREVLRTLPDSLRNLTFNRFFFGESGELAVLKIVKRNQDRLTSIKFLNCEGISSQTLQTILIHCRFLIEIENDKRSALEVVVINQPWGCVSLERLNMTFKAGYRPLENNEQPSKEKVERALLIDCKKLVGLMDTLTSLKESKIRIGLPNQLCSTYWIGDVDRELIRRLIIEDAESNGEEFLQKWLLLCSSADLGYFVRF